jgi:predicted MFS family arabinose efflux permease
MSADVALAGRATSALPLSGLLALTTASFLTILTEALPAGLLPQIGTALSVSEAMAGQLVTVYAIGSLAAAIPLTAATRS